ncbi:MAG TPA: four-carbon acid sugar kinase family protein [Solirubrobacteraceae bacterium]
MLAVIDDDPTGAQQEADVPVVVSWSEPLLRRVAQRRPRAVHLLTNSRALEPDNAYRVVREAGEAAVASLSGADVVLRGDSTLRAHLLEEYRGLRDAAFEGRDTALMLVPALPSAGRVTVDGVHQLQRNGQSTPLNETEYARDGDFSYRSARLVDWAEERSGGYFAATRGCELHLEELRSGGPEAVMAALGQVAARAPAVFAPDACTDADLDIIAAGLRSAVDAGTPVIVRSAPAFVGRLAHTTAHGLVAAPRAHRGLLVVCGSYVGTTSRQLQRLVARRPNTLVEVDSRKLASSDAAVTEAVAAVSELISSGGLAIVATSRERDHRGLAHGESIARRLARVVAELRTQVDVVLSKGGITSAVNLSDGLGAQEADVIGPVAPGISLWRVMTPEGRPMSYVVFPGNVGADDALADVVDMLAPER